MKKYNKNKSSKKFDCISETSKHTSELRLDSDIQYSEQFYCPTILKIDNLYRYFYAQYCEVRFKFINQIVKEIAPDLIIEFASGLSSRGLIFTETNSKLTYIDSDLQKINTFKKLRLKKKNINCPKNLIFKGFNLVEDDVHFFKKLIKGKNKRVVFITEGLLPYLNHEEILKVHSKLSRITNNNNQYFWISDLNISYDKLSNGEEKILKSLKRTKNKIEKRINWKILSHPFASTDYFSRLLTSDALHKKNKIRFYTLKNYKGKISSRENLKDLLTDKGTKLYANKLLRKKTTIFKLRFQ